MNFLSNRLNQNKNENLLMKLVQKWQIEKFSQELLPYPEKLITEILIQIENQENELRNKNEDDEKISILMEIKELDLDRTKFVLKDLLRVRLAKINKYIFYLIKMDLNSILSKSEFEFTCDLFKLKRGYFTNNLYRNLPSRLNDMIHFPTRILVKPNENHYVFVKCISNDLITIGLKEVYPRSSEYISIKKGDLICCPMSLVREYIEVSQMELV